jgi:prephenate dehydratase
VTRFVVLGQSDAEPTGDDKTALAFTVRENIPGALSEVLRPISDEGIQLSKVESRPSKDRLFEYVFLLDLLGHRPTRPWRGRWRRSSRSAR